MIKKKKKKKKRKEGKRLKLRCEWKHAILVKVQFTTHYKEKLAKYKCQELVALPAQLT